jgi:hypothetical protein
MSFHKDAHFLQPCWLRRARDGGGGNAQRRPHPVTIYVFNTQRMYCGGWMADIESHTDFILGQRQVFSDWWVSGNEHNLCQEYALLDEGTVDAETWQQ